MPGPFTGSAPHRRIPARNPPQETGQGGVNVTARAMSLPNILFLMDDERRADLFGFAGNTVVRTPVLDELARTGVTFANAYTPSPICIPARQSLMAGQFPRTCGCEVYGQDLPPGHLTWAGWLARHGYETVVCGKLHHMDVDQMRGWTARPFGDMRVDPRYIPDKAESAPRRSPPAEGKWSDAKEIRRAGVGCGPHERFDEMAVVAAENVIEEHFSHRFYDRATPGQPLVLKVSLLLPHYPYLADEERFGYYLNRVQPFLDEPVSDHPVLSARRVPVGDAPDAVTPREVRRATTAYYAMCEAIDARFGRVIDALKYVGQDIDEWIVIYTSDHGEMLGEHGVWEKQRFYEGSARVPLVIRWPRGFAGGRVVQENVSLCDLFATLCELTGLPIPPSLDSRSLAPLLRGEPCAWDDEAVSQFGGRHLMIKRGPLKYQFHGDDGPEVLFDLDRDPTERTDFIGDECYAADLRTFRDRRSVLGF
jgi:choline-sulfatase